MKSKTGKTPLHMIRLSQEDRDRVELISTVYGFAVSDVHRVALRFLFSLTGLPAPDDGPRV